MLARASGGLKDLDKEGGLEAFKCVLNARFGGVTLYGDGIHRMHGADTRTLFACSTTPK